MNVLLVDDEAMMRKMVKLTLQKHGFQVFDAASGAEALAVCDHQLIDILVTDVAMENMDGWELANLLKQRYPQLPVVFMSGYPIDFEEERPKYARCAFVPKPFQPGELMNAISEVTGTITPPTVPPQSKVDT